MNRFMVIILVALWSAVLPAQEQAFLSVRSDTGNAIVYLDTLLIGRTPFDSAIIPGGSHVLRCLPVRDRDWYISPYVETLFISPGESIHRTVHLQSLRREPTVFRSGFPISFESGLPAVPEKALDRQLSMNTTPLYLTTAGAILTGAAAAYFKIRADDYYDEYQRTGNKALLDKVKRRDTYAGVSLALCEVNIVLLTYLLLSQ